MKTRYRILACSMLWALLLGSLWAAAPADDFRLQEYLGHNWQHEAVTFPISGDALAQAKADHALCGPDGKAIAYQLVAGTTPQDTRIAFQSDLPPYEARAFKFTTDRALTATDLKIAETADYIELTNAMTGIRIAKALAAGQGPIAGVRLTSGAWVTGSRLTTNEPVARYEAKIIARGPVYAEVVAQAGIGKTATWEQRYRIYNNEPVVLVDETSAVDGPAASFSLDLQKNLNPDTLLYRSGNSGNGISYGQNQTYKLATGNVYLLEPWLQWQNANRQGNYFGLYREDGNDLLAIAAREAGAWVDPAIPGAKRASRQQWLLQDAQGLHVDFPLKMGQRKWMFIALPKEPCLVETKDATISARSPLPYQYLIKYGHFPLDLIKDYVLDWDASKETHPRLLVAAKDVDRYLAKGGLTSLVPALNATQRAVNVFLEQPNLPYGSAPHMDSRSVIEAIMQDDSALRPGVGTPEERAHLRSMLAFLGYTIARPEYWSPERGYRANPNMTTMVAGYQVAIGALLASHPCSKEWMKTGLAELKNELDTWSDDNGGWLEAPHYAMVSYDFILGGFLMAYNSTGDETIFSPRLRKVIEWDGKITTPPDSRTGGFRHLPPIGNTWLNEPTGEFSILAMLYKDRDPEFSAQMQWLFQQHGSRQYPGIGGSGASTDGYRNMLFDPALPAKAPPYGSELFPKTGVILRNVFASDRETTLYMIAGPNHDHYDYDSGSITLWGKGRIVCDDFGYNSRAPMYEHSMIESPLTGYIMNVQNFVPAPRLDYVRGLAGGWTRQIAFVKDTDPLAPNYFVIADSLNKPTSGTWRLWCTAQEVRLSPQQALIVGKEDVDTDVFFLQPQNLALKTEDHTVKTFGLDKDGNGNGNLATTQTGIIATLANNTGVSTVVFPRLKNEAAPTVTTLADGKVAKIQHARGTDYVFLAAEPFTFTEGDITFQGTAGVVQISKDGTRLTLGAPGHLTVGKQEITKE